MLNTEQSDSLIGVAIVGMAGRFPGADNIEEFWQNLVAGSETVSSFDPNELDPAPSEEKVRRDPNYVRARGVVAGAECFDAALFAINPREAELMDPQQRVFLETVWAAFEDAGYDPLGCVGLVGVFAGMANNTYSPAVLAPRQLERTGAAALQTMLGNEKDYLATRTSYALNLRGPSINIQTACSTSLVAVAQACHALQSYQCDMAIAGGVSITCPQKRGYLCHEGGIVSPDGHCRAFDEQAAGTVFSNGVGVVVLKRLSDAISDHDHIYAVIKGVAVNNDGSARVSFAAPSVDGQAEAISMAHAMAGVEPDSITYVEAHGTGTALGDPVEIAGLTQAFRLGTERRQFCAIGSVKTNIGHLDAAAGVAGLIKTALALKNAQIPASLHFTCSNPKIDFASTPFYVNHELTHWPVGLTPRRAGVSSFGSGGTNAHVVLEEPPILKRSPTAPDEQLFLISGRTPLALEQAAIKLASHLTPSIPNTSDSHLADIAYTLQTGRHHFAHRKAVVGRTRSEVAAALRSTDPQNSISRRCDFPDAPVVFMFPGQGVQHINMGRGLYRSEPTFTREVDECSEELRPLLELDIRSILFPAPGREVQASHQLKETFFTQPALFVIEYALARLLMEWGVTPKAFIGHSLGEYVAASLTRVFSRNTALKILAARARLMQKLPAGAMLVVRLPEAGIKSQLEADLSIAAINSPQLTVVSGPLDAIDTFSEKLRKQKVTCRRLATSHAFHSAMLDPILPEFAEVLRSVKMSVPQAPFVSSLTGTWITNEEAASPDYWVAQVRQPVRFADGISELLKNPANILLEVGPGHTLGTLARQHPARQASHEIVASLRADEMGDSDQESGDAKSLRVAAGLIWAAGGRIDWVRFHANSVRHRVPLPTYPFERKRFWIDSPLPEDSAHTAASADPSKTLTNSELQPMRDPIPLQVDWQPLQNGGSASSARVSATLHRLQAVFSDISGQPLEHLAPSATFLDLGLDSLLLTQASTAIEKSFGVKVAFRQLLEELSTFDALAAYLAPRLPSPDPTTTGDVVERPTSAPEPCRPVATPPDAIEALVSRQLEIMEKQLEVLRHSRSPNATRPRSPTPYQAAAPAAINSVAAPGLNVSKSEPQPLGPYKPVQKSAGQALTDKQQRTLTNLIGSYVGRTGGSKRLTAYHRKHHADPRAVSGFRPVWKQMIYPIVTERSQGSRLWDVDGNEYIDFTNGFGALLFGHRPEFLIRALSAQIDKGFEIGPQSPLAGPVAELICQMTGMERATFCNTGSEAVVGAIRTARTVTGRDKIAMFSGSYHGIFDEVLARPHTINGSLASRPVTPGVPQSAVDNIVVLDYGDPASLDILRAQGPELAAILVEPVQSRRPDLVPKEFLQQLRDLTRQMGTALIFDEIVTGFRVHPQGAQGFFGIQADIATYGKVIGGGIPVGVLAGQAKYLDTLDGGQWDYEDTSGPDVGMTFFAGTFVRHPLALAACWACVNHIRDNTPELHRNLNRRTRQLVEAMSGFANQVGVPLRIPSFASWMCFNFPHDVPHASLFWASMRAKGIFIWEGRPSFLTTAHTDADIEAIFRAFRETVVELQQGGFLPGEPPQDFASPPPGARLGKDRQGNSAWFVPDPERPGKYLQVADVQ